MARKIISEPEPEPEGNIEEIETQETQEEEEEEVKPATKMLHLPELAR